MLAIHICPHFECVDAEIVLALIYLCTFCLTPFTLVSSLKMPEQTGVCVKPEQTGVCVSVWGGWVCYHGRSEDKICVLALWHIATICIPPIIGV